jgi:pimeloyl-ACP methyl ester carboxylesterase
MSAPRRLVLIHGFTERPTMWDDMTTAWDDGSIAVCTPSIPGHGNHPEIPDIRTAESYCEALLQQIPNDNLPLIVVGHSMGGYLASTLVRMVPERIQAIGFFHSKAGSDSAEKIEDRKRAIATAAQNKDLYLATMLRNTLAEANYPRFQKELAMLIEQAKHDISVACIQAAQEVMIQRPDNIGFLSAAAFPIHYFLGKQDRSILFEHMQEELLALPSASMQVAESAGHMGHIECRTEAIEWLKRVCAFNE